MSNPRKPDNVHRLKGTWRRDRHSHPAQVVVPMDPEPPDHLTAPETDAWRELVAACRDYLAQSDRVTVELTARLLALHRAGKAKGVHDVLLAKLLDKIGATPAGRARLQPINAGVAPANPFTDL